MAKVFLRVYNHEIESMIEGGQLDEAVAHCQYILKAFPMHVDTYRLLGKAFLEARRYTDAADIFQRVLMVVPDDFVSHVGMSIIRDDESRLDDAIWHMERAFEVQPSNSAIQGELRRLYGRRDGVEPNKIRLSRDALANMYSQGELFNQAIAEIRSVLAEDTNRPDLQVMLARAYFRSGRKVEAAEMAAALLKKYPYNLDSLRVLVDVLPGTAREENTQVYRQRLHNLDPYSSFAINSAFASDQVADSAVSLERLEYKSAPASVNPQPDWASSLGIKINDEKQLETPPAWMQAEETPDQPRPSDSETSISSEPVSSEPVSSEQVSSEDAGSVPEWMRSAGWQESSKAGQLDSKENETEESLPGESIAKADIPEWIKPMAPSEIAEEENPEPEDPTETLPIGKDGIPVWLNPNNSKKDIGMTNLDNQQLNEPQQSNSDDIPSGLKPGDPEAVDKKHNDIPSEQVEPQDRPVEPQPVKSEELPDWLKSMAQDGTKEQGQDKPLMEPIETKMESPEPLAENPDELPDWLKSLAPSEPLKDTSTDIHPPVFTQQSSDEVQSSTANDVPDWLKTMDSSKNQPELPVDKSIRQVEYNQEGVEPAPADPGGIPEWFKNLAPAQNNANASAENNKFPVEPPDANGIQTPDLNEPLDSTNTPGDPQSGLNSVENPFSKDGPVPDWLAGNRARADAAALSAKTTEVPALDQPGKEPPNPSGSVPRMPNNESIPQELTASDSIQPSGEVRPLNIDDDAFRWLESLAAKQGAKPDELLSEPGERSEEMPEWLLEASEKPTPEPPKNKEEKPKDPSAGGTDDTMVWLEQMVADQGTHSEEIPIAPVAEKGIPPDRRQSAIQNPPAAAPSEEITPLLAKQFPGEEDITITTWLSKKDVKEALEKKAGEKITENEPTAAATELPDWLKDLEKPAASVESTKTENELPEWLRYSTPSESPDKVPPVPPVEQTQESALPAWLDEGISGTVRAVPTLPEEWLPASEEAVNSNEGLQNVEPAPVPDKSLQVDSPEALVSASGPVVGGKSEFESASGTIAKSPAESAVVPAPVPVRMPTLKQTGMLSHIPVQDKDSELLASAQDVLDQNSLNDAMKEYSKLIKKGRLLDEVIHDLREAIYRYPVDVIIWQTLGDAYMRSNRLQDALDAYTKAEELLR